MPTRHLRPWFMMLWIFRESASMTAVTSLYVITQGQGHRKVWKLEGDHVVGIICPPPPLGQSAKKFDWSPPALPHRFLRTWRGTQFCVMHKILEKVYPWKFQIKWMLVNSLRLTTHIFLWNHRSDICIFQICWIDNNCCFWRFLSKMYLKISILGTYVVCTKALKILLGWI